MEDGRGTALSGGGQRRAAGDRYDVEAARAGCGEAEVVSAPVGLPDLLGVAAAVLDDEGRIILWSPEAEHLFGYGSAEALGQYAADLLIDLRHKSRVLELFGRVLAGESWAGGFPIHCKDGTVRRTAFRNVPLQDDQHHTYALGVATDQQQLRELETGLALTSRLFHHAPFGLAVLDPHLRCMLVNPVLEKIHGRPVGETVGRHSSEVVPVPDTSEIEAALHRVLATGEPLLNQQLTLSTDPPLPGPHGEQSWSSSYYRLQDQHGRILGVAVTVVDDTERHRTTPNGTEPRPSGCARGQGRFSRRGSRGRGWRVRG
ncbi:PAS domain-containing protein [Streptomyces sp. NPDC093586]|uniref:PAS domain-containing protein n=1 Tax=Streptomyces sp. NPDC093586 TaxID=3366042 RepID=UPI00382949D5